MASIRLFFLRRYVRPLNAYERWRDKRDFKVTRDGVRLVTRTIKRHIIVGDQDGGDG